MNYKCIGHLFGRGIPPWRQLATYPIASIVAPIDSEESTDPFAEGQPKASFYTWHPSDKKICCEHCRGTGKRDSY